MNYTFIHTVIYFFLAMPVLYFLIRLLGSPYWGEDDSKDQRIVRCFMISLIVSVIVSFAIAWNNSRFEITPHEYVAYNKIKNRSFDIYKKAGLNVEDLNTTFKEIELDKIVTNAELKQVERIQSRVYRVETKLVVKEKETQARQEAKIIKSQF